MWPNGFGTPGPFQTNFNPDEFSQMPFGAPQGQQFFQHQGMMPFNNLNAEERNYAPVDQPFAIQGAFMQNQNIGPQFSPSPFMTPQATPPVSLASRAPAQMNARAAELKAELLKRKTERASSATPPGPAKQAAHPENSKHGSEKNVNTADQKREQDVNELISQYSGQSTPATTVKQEKKASNITNVAQIPASPTPSAKPQVPSNKVTKAANNGKTQTNRTKDKAFGSRHTSNGSVSEGEIFEDPIPHRAASPMHGIEPKSNDKMKMPEDRQDRSSRDDHSVKPPYPRSYREDARRRTPSPKPRVPPSNGRDDRREEAESRMDRRQRADSVKFEGKHPTDAERQLVLRAEPRNEATRQPQSNGALARVELNRQIREQNPPSLLDVLPHDEDLREWLEITGYHNEIYRSKILNRRRAIAALDAQRDKLLAEMAAEERGVAPPVVLQQSAPSMLPPPIPNRAEDRVESKSIASVIEAQPERVVSNKRPYSELQDSRDAPSTEKMSRTEPRSYAHPAQKVKDEDDFDTRRPRSSGFDSNRRSSPPRREDHEVPRQYFRGRGRSRSRDGRSLSPGRRPYEDRQPPRSRAYDSDYYPRDSFNDRSFEYTSGYRGKDSNYRGRGRGRGRGDSRDSREYPSGGQDFKNEPQWGSKIANNRPYRDGKGFERGGRGDTRYFIVKSFNEENVLKCIEDSVWTTQLQNGPVFEEAFETCKNVILVFSINKSRAFQGYARMESLPGSVEIPHWQRAITWESAGAFRVRWLVICATRFHRVGHLKNAFNENQAVLIGKDGQEIEEHCGASLIELIDEEAEQALRNSWVKTENWEDLY
ncbi:YTH-domain-containing protein [Mollisia scopiformis]|uniref:YTH-domain-containing protein n=1 Tax=Mollisia scopiformis TaxID=149040 RepID=A0A194XP73_MOLSC|nr:YTH-domain-containing protein [Mollisia scopiformis]KUJ21879.1 YTH-domain-containing protein [Mollisia scopiformis]